MKLVLAEKPSVAQSIAKVLGATKREDGYLEGNGYVVSWCVGHLVELSQPEAYDEKYNKLNQGISVSGIAVSISWPPSVSGSGSSASWQSQPVYDNVAGASFNGLVVGGTAFSCTFSENGDVYVGSRIYRPTTTIKFSYFS